MKNSDDIPKVGMVLVWDCINCDQEEEMKVTKNKKQSPNDDGSTCYTIELKCPNCNYINGEYRPIWYNLYSRGQMA